MNVRYAGYIQNVDAELTHGQLRNQLESSKGDVFSTTIIADFLYGAEDGSELPGSMDKMTHYNILHTWTSSQWTALLSKYVCFEPTQVRSYIVTVAGTTLSSLQRLSLENLLPALLTIWTRQKNRESQIK
jgi:Zn-dependent M16 (insulinase) family peptidase